MITRSVRLFLATGLLASVGLQGQTPAFRTRPAAESSAPLVAPPPDQVRERFDIEGAEVDDVLNALEELTGRYVIRPQALPPGKYTLRVRQMKVSDIITGLETSLEKNGIAVVPLGDKFLEAVPLATVRSEAPQLIEGSTLDLPPSGRIGTKIFQLTYLRARELFDQGMITGMFSAGIGGSVLVIDKANAALVTDTIANLQRVERLIGALDRPNGEGLVPRFYVLQNAKASNVVTELHAIYSGEAQKAIGTATTFNADDRTNQVIILADPRQIPMFDRLIANLDGPSGNTTRNEVIYLKYATSKDVAQLLSSIVSGQNASTARTAQTAVRPGEVAAAVPFGSQNIGQGGLIGSATQAAQQAQALQAAVRSSGSSAAGSLNEGAFSNLVQIQSDDRSNSVVVSGTPDDIRLLKQLIEKLDVELAQVRIDCVIAEVDLTDTDVSGISALNLTFGTGGSGGTSIQQFSGSTAGWDITSGVVNPLAFAAALNTSSAGQTNRVKILSEPVIMTTHNHQGEVSVGEQYPIITGTTSTPVSGTSSSSLATSSSVSYQKIDIDLKVTPLVGENGDVQLTVDQTVDDIEGYTTIDSNEQPIIGNREATSFVTVKDGQMIVLGGLQKTQKTQTHDKIGLLYEIPILSQLFGSHTDEIQRTELLLFLRPHVITVMHSTDDTQKKIDELSNKKEVDKFMTNPGAADNSKTQNFFDRFKSN